MHNWLSIHWQNNSRLNGKRRLIIFAFYAKTKSIFRVLAMGWDMVKESAREHDEQNCRSNRRNKYAKQLEMYDVRCSDVIQQQCECIICCMQQSMVDLTKVIL